MYSSDIGLYSKTEQYLSIYILVSVAFLIKCQIVASGPINYMYYNLEVCKVNIFLLFQKRQNFQNFLISPLLPPPR